ncbi:hypothetical protein NST23_18770 [Brevibacillus sp. FSL K6-0770]|uniref:hypothetical protein n=1 Tax=Brevibacillus sp. FSL K6-0770 TaxID=2954673 RepID=UPI0030F765FC
MRRFIHALVMPFLAIMMVIGMIYTIIEDANGLSKWSDLTKNLAQINVTLALGYAALVAGIAAALKHAGKFAQHKDDLYGMIKAFVYFIVMNLWMYMWSFSKTLAIANVVAFLGTIWTFGYLSKHFLRVIREMLNAEER